MAVFKCKMCGGDLPPDTDSTTCECEFCGTVQTVPSDDGEKKTNLFNRANRLRMNAEFDKAAAVYESIAAEYPEEAEAYWGLCLCAYGIEYVDDPATGEKKPTCHRTLPTSIMEDSNFEQACDNADAIARRVYREEAKAIDRIQKNILSIVASEDPYDVFICYKETADEGGRTEDSVLAQEIYDALTGKGLKVFFSRITLEDKLGQQYEPYIYAALSSAKVMLAVGTRFEHYDAVWVKNEWMRFLSMMKTDKSKTLIPCYKGLDAYDMPKEFKNLQAQDMNKLGWLQDLCRGVIKLLGKDGPEFHTKTSAEFVEEIVQKIAAQSLPKDNLEKKIKNGFEFLKSERWEEADECAEAAIHGDPSCSDAYLIKLMVETKAKTPGDICPGHARDISNNQYYKQIIRLGNDVQRKQINQIAANYFLPYVETISDYKNAKEKIKEKFPFNDISEVIDKCDKRIKELGEDIICSANIELGYAKSVSECEKIIEKLQSIAEFADITDAVAKVNEKISILKNEEVGSNNINEIIEKLKADFDAKRQIASEKAREVQKANSEINLVQNECDKIRKIIHEYNIELKNLKGLFSGKRRKELEELIADETAKLKREEEKSDSLERVRDNVQSQSIEFPDKQELDYLIAKEYLNSGMYSDAYETFQRIRNYKDVALILQNNPDLREAIVGPFTRCGNIVSFGHYTIDNSQSKAPMEWIVLDATETKSLLVSKYIIDIREFNHEDEDDWDFSDIESWLNKDFFNLAFSNEEQNKILTSTIITFINGDYTLESEDKVFLLSRLDVEKYFPTNAARRCSVSPYLYNTFNDWKKKDYKESGNSADWWLCSNTYIEEYENMDGGYADYVDGAGRICNETLSCSLGIRPAIWIKTGD